MKKISSAVAALASSGASALANALASALGSALAFALALSLAPAFAAEPAASAPTAAAASAPRDAMQPAPLSSITVEIAYLNLANFDEVQQNPTRDTRWADDLARYFLSRAESTLDGRRITIVITNMQLAGQYQPWLSGSVADMRVMDPRSPPRMDLTFRLMAKDGTTLAEGSRKMRDANFMTRRARHGGAYDYEKNLIDDFIRKEISEGPR